MSTFPAMWLDLVIGKTQFFKILYDFLCLTEVKKLFLRAMLASFLRPLPCLTNDLRQPAPW